ncbi:hypothetical protein GUJ93_ZPchr0005g15271 [Zizania palustris]|uniref:Uncharacterized protein n=1 Tax=Zizania palustris TaxID=103762 RepID=A0A8J5VQJ2_ZIZPA|nr:hypothetical protein GUJ93_ZPchr0005g15271 [Zizania palustris]
MGDGNRRTCTGSPARPPAARRPHVRRQPPTAGRRTHSRPAPAVSPARPHPVGGLPHQRRGAVAHLRHGRRPPLPAPSAVAHSALARLLVTSSTKAGGRSSGPPLRTSRPRLLLESWCCCAVIPIQLPVAPRLPDSPATVSPSAVIPIQLPRPPHQRQRLCAVVPAPQRQCAREFGEPAGLLDFSHLKPKT